MNSCDAVLNFCSSYFLPQTPEPRVSEVTMDDAALLLLIGASSMSNNVPSETSPNKENPMENLRTETSDSLSLQIPQALRQFPHQLSQSSEKPKRFGNTPEDKPYVCPKDGCEGAFKRKAHLEMHIRIHTDERPFICSFDDCGKSFRSKSHLNTHKR